MGQEFDVGLINPTDLHAQEQPEAQGYDQDFDQDESFKDAFTDLEIPAPRAEPIPPEAQDAAQQLLKKDETLAKMKEQFESGKQIKFDEIKQKVFEGRQDTETKNEKL